MSTWTPGKKVGDEVLYTPGGFSRALTRLTIVCETATQFILSGNGTVLVRKKDGYEVGGRRGYATDLTDAYLKTLERIAREDAISHQAFVIQRRVKDIYDSGAEGRAWLVKHIGPLLPKEGE